jgi:hypothetical protein
MTSIYVVNQFGHQYVVIEQGGDGNSAPLRVAPNEMTSIANLKKQLDTNKIEDKTKELFKDLGF